MPTAIFNESASRGAARALLRGCVVAFALSCANIPASAAAKAWHSQSAARSFQAFVSSLWPLAQQRGVSRAIFDEAFSGVSFDPQVVAYTMSQAEFVSPIWQYIATLVSSARVDRGRNKASAEEAWLTKATRTYGVDRGAILGIWGLETDFGGLGGSHDVVKALASLAFVHFRGDYFRDELLSALAVLQEGDIAPRAMRGSWAGATGQTQFMPSSFLIYGVDFEGHGRRDIWNSVGDAIGSTANFLAAHGWTADLPWGFEVRLPADFALTDADSSQPASLDSFRARGVQRADGTAIPSLGEGRLLIPAGLKGPIFIVTTNFDIIMMYNASTSYALAVALLGDLATGGEGLVTRWPIGDDALSTAQVRSLQAKLKKMGYNVGEIDGKLGEALRSAVRAYQERNRLSPDGYADVALLKRIDRGDKSVDVPAKAKNAIWR